MLPVIVPVKNFIPFIITISASWNVEYNDKHHILNNNVRMIFFISVIFSMVINLSIMC